MSRADVVVVGAGMAGSAAARSLAGAGREVVLLEQFDFGHRRGSSHGASRIFRYSYPDPTYVALSMEALGLWRELEDATGRELVTTTGGLDAGPGLTAQAEALGACGAKFEWVAGPEVGERFPALSFPAEDTLLFQPDAGIVRAEDALRAFITAAEDGGADVRWNTRVQALRASGDGVEVDTPEGSVTAEVAVVTAGPWAPALLAAAGIDLPAVPTCETVAYFSLADDDLVPSLVDWDDPIFYALASPGQGLKAGLHHGGPVADPDTEGAPSGATVALLREAVTRRYPGAASEPTLVETCFYTNTDDERFILERRGPIVVGSACSGHGFKFAPLTGRRLADLALNP
ncbi:MAG: FAD-dependent oxidoreductase [Actinomycetota bacterium]|nr:FAD-dependent oxidoreductase [Actinomycetota bacterium]